VFWADAAEAAGVAPVMLRRYVILLRRLDEIAEKAAVDAESLVSNGFSAAELAARLYDRNPAAGLRVLIDLKEGRGTLEQIRAELAVASPGKVTTSADSRSRSLRERGRLIERCEAALQAQAHLLFGPNTQVARRPALRYFRRVGFDVMKTGGLTLGPAGILGGADLYFPEPATSGRDPLEDLAQSLQLSTYLPSFYIVFAPGMPDETCRRAIDALDLFQATWIGLLVFDDETIVARRSPQGRPIPDRTAEYSMVAGALAGRR
jgi:hypothetical protein